MWTVVPLLPVVFVLSAAFLLQRGLYNPQKIFWYRIVAGLVILGLILGGLVWLTIIDEYGGFYAFIQAIFITFAAILISVWLLTSLNGRRKFAAVFMGIIFPVILFSSVLIGADYSPDAITRKNGQAIAQALKQYHILKGTYPQTLDELVPTYLSNLNVPRSSQTWLYKPSDGDFLLGYVDEVEPYGYDVCTLTSGTTEWDCKLDIKNSFNLPPTPIPTRD